MLSANELVFKQEIKYDGYVENFPIYVYVDPSQIFFSGIIHFGPTKPFAHPFG